MEINYEVYNTLNLINEKLGKLYVEEKFNPFHEEYVLDFAHAKQCVDLREEKNVLNTPKVLEFNKEDLVHAIEQSKFLGDEILKSLQGNFLHPNEQVNEVRAYLEIRQMLLNLIDLEEVNYEEIADVIKTEMCLNPRLAKYMEKTYYKNFVLENAIAYFQKQCKEHAKKQTKTVSKVQEKAQEKIVKKEQEKVIKATPIKVAENHKIQSKTVLKTPAKNPTKSSNKKPTKKVYKEESL